jgi:histidyl-tRNA synthetase
MAYTLPRGTYDILPQDSYKWQYIQKIFRETAKAYNFKEIVTPIFEKADLFERSVGDTTDIVQKEMYKFSDKKGRSFALRPEGTASVVRSFVQNNLGKFDNNVKLFYIGPMFRYDRPQKGRYRQFYQYGVEYFGNDHPYVDAEVISLGYNFLKKLGLSNFSLEINSIGNKKSSEKYNKVLIEYFTPYYNELCPDCQSRLERNPKRVLDCKVPTCKKIAQDAPSMLQYLDEESSKHFEEVQSYLSLLEIPYVVNPKIVRGLDYYTKTAFEIINNNLGAQNALLGGGRYDGLVKELGGKDVSAIGFAGGFERLIFSMEQENLSFGDLPNPKYYFVAIGEEARKKAIVLINQMRMMGYDVEFLIDKISMKSQMKAANKLGAKYTLILGEDELSKNVVVKKNMETGEQIEIKISKLLEK